MTSSARLVLVDPEVTDVHASKQGVEEMHVNWNVGYAPTDYPRKNARVVFGTIHAGNPEGVVEVSVATLMTYTEDEDPGDDFESMLVESPALESLWDIARIAFYGVSGISGVLITVPEMAPEPALRKLKRADEEDNETPEVQSAAVK